MTLKQKWKRRRTMTNRIDFQVVFSVKRANPNGDPIDGNRPRQLADGRGEVSDVCIKRKIRNRLDDMGETILIKSAENCLSDKEPMTVLDRYQSKVTDGKTISKLDEKIIEAGLNEFIDVRMFGQVFRLSPKNNTFC